jgi:hypothetical protein
MVVCGTARASDLLQGRLAFILIIACIQLTSNGLNLEMVTNRAALNEQLLQDDPKNTRMNVNGQRFLYRWQSLEDF